MSRSKAKPLKKANRVMAKLAFTCGTTGGHVYPAIALAEKWPGKSIFICSENKQDKQILEAYPYPKYPIPASEKPNPITLLRAFMRSRAALKSEKADMLIATGGYLTAPVILAAKTLGIPIILLEQNSFPGRVTKLFKGLANVVCLSFEESMSFIQGKNVKVTGNPVRDSAVLSEDLKAEIKAAKGKILVVMGGSQGAQALNDCITESAPILLQNGWSIIHLMGTGNYPYAEPFKVEVNKEGAAYIRIGYLEGLTGLYVDADLVISRAGATSIAELLYYQKKAILIPYPFAKDNHQEANAIAFEKRGWGLWMKQSELSVAALLDKMEKVEAMPLPVSEPKNPRDTVLREIQALLKFATVL